MSDSYPQLHITSRDQWRQWLAEHGTSSPGVWVVTWKKPTGKPHVPYNDVVDEAIAAGWVDSRPRSVDEHRSALLVTPRNPSSRWSAKNKQRVRELTAAGLMQPAGVAVVAAAQASGTWNALNDVETLTEPDDLLVALHTNPNRPALLGLIPTLNPPGHPRMDLCSENRRHSPHPHRPDRQRRRSRHPRQPVAPTQTHATAGYRADG